MSNAVLNKNSKKAYWAFWLIVLLPIFCVGTATLMYYAQSGIPIGKTNKGTLIHPPIPLEKLHLKQVSGEPFDKNLLENQWGIFIWLHDIDEALSQRILNIIERVHVALHKESGRVRRYILLPTASRALSTLLHGTENNEWQILHVDLDESNLQAWKATGLTHDQKVALFLVDPLGHVMMHYKQNQIGKDVLKDLQKLLRVNKMDTR